jgi:hypothetical protein
MIHPVDDRLAVLGAGEQRFEFGAVEVVLRNHPVDELLHCRLRQIAVACDGNAGGKQECACERGDLQRFH